MSRVTPHATSFDAVKGKVVVVSGGASGIGAATVERFYRDQALVVFGDTDEEAAKDLVDRLRSGIDEDRSLTFVKCDVTDYADVYKLFKTAYDRHGSIAHAMAITAISDGGDWFDSGLTIDSVEHAEEMTAVLDVNMKGTAIFARVAVVFLRSNMNRKENRSLTLTSSVAGITELPGLYMYQASMYGILGLMRSMRKTIYERDKIRVNCICPGTSETLVSTSVMEEFDLNEHYQTLDDCARFYVGVANNPSMNGKSIYVEAGKGWEFEDALSKTMPQWLGKEPTKMLRQKMKATGKVY